MAELDPETTVTDLIGKEFGPYTLVKRLGVGGMAETFEAIRHGRSGFEQRVCLKLVRPGFRDNVDSIKLFEREARLAAKLHHSRIVGVIDFGEIHETLYMTLELVDGADLQALLDERKRLSPEHVALIGHDLADALGHAHDPPVEDENSASEAAVGIIHRDISPSNVMISRYGEVKLTDFGLASFAASGSRQSEIRGKFPYMAPERLRADALDGRSDLFSLGVVLFEALAGRRPYEGGNDPATIMLIMEGDHPPLSGLAPGTPPDLCRVVESLIEADQDHRPKSAAALVEQLDPFVPPPSARRKLGKIAERARAHRTTQKPISSRRLAESELPERAGSPARASSGERSGFKRWLVAGAIAVLFALGLAGAAARLWPSDQSDPETVNEVATENRPSTAPDVGANPPDGREIEQAPRPESGHLAKESPTSTESAEDSPRAVSAPRPARLTVQVAPWGEVWIDGKARGTAPLKNISLKPGRYKIAAGQSEPMQTRVVRLREGQQRTLRFDLAE